MAKPIKSLISLYFAHQKQHDWKMKLLQDWPIIMGNLALQVSIHKIYQNSITLHVQSNSWMQELYCLSHVILEKINGYLGSKKLHTIHFKLANTTPTRASTKNSENALEYKKPEITLNIRQKKALHKINDEELSKALEGFFARCLYK